MGSGLKQPSSSEQKNIIIARKSIHLNRDLTSGSIISALDLIMKRPGDGISPMEYEELIGKKINKDLKADHKLSLSDFE
jgi:sialic acid synthase SpsE